MTSVTDKPVVEVVFPRATAEQVAKLRLRLSGPGLATVSEQELIVAVERGTAECVRDLVALRLHPEEFEFHPSWGDVEHPEVTLKRPFSWDAAIPVGGEMWPLTTATVSGVVQGHWCEVLEDLPPGAVVDALAAMGHAEAIQVDGMVKVGEYWYGVEDREPSAGTPAKLAITVYHIDQLPVLWSDDGLWVHGYRCPVCKHWVAYGDHDVVRDMPAELIDGIAPHPEDWGCLYHCAQAIVLVPPQ